MKLPIKHIALLVVVSLIAIFAYQSYWLASMYHTLGEQAEATIQSAIKNADHVELFMRADSASNEQKAIRNTSGQVHGDMSISFTTSFEMDEGKAKSKSTLAKEAGGESSDTLKIKKDFDNPDTNLTVGENISSLYRLATYLQKGLHMAIDEEIPINIMRFDSILHHDLHEANLDLMHYTLIVDLKKDSILASTLPANVDTFALDRHELIYDYQGEHAYHIYIEPIGTLILKQMSGILVTSFVILVILGFSFWYLIRTLLKQKTLDEMKSDFTNNITHELKTPIAVAYAANDALLNFNQATEKEKRDKYLRISQEQLQRLSGLVEQILSTSMERRKTFRLHTEEVLLRPLIDSLIEQHTLKARKPVTIECEITPYDLTVMADRTHFSNILSNLIDNAIKYSSGETVIYIRCNRLGEQVQIAVSDNGTGIPAEKQKHIFDKFYRIPTGNLHNVKGYGLGLYYVKTMIEKHGGTVRVQSEPGCGSTFILTL